MLYTKFVYLIQTHRQKSNPGKRELSQDKCHGCYLKYLTPKDSPAFLFFMTKILE